MNTNNEDNEDLPKLDDETDRKVPVAEEGVYNDGTARDSAVQRTLRRSPRLHSGTRAGRN